MKHDHTIKDLQVSVEAMEYSWECVIEALYGRTDIDVGMDEVIKYLRSLKHDEKLIQLMSSDAYIELYNKYEEVYGV